MSFTKIDHYEKEYRELLAAKEQEEKNEKEK